METPTHLLRSQRPPFMAESACEAAEEGRQAGAQRGGGWDGRKAGGAKRLRFKLTEDAVQGWPGSKVHRAGLPVVLRPQCDRRSRRRAQACLRHVAGQCAQQRNAVLRGRHGVGGGGVDDCGRERGQAAVRQTTWRAAGCMFRTPERLAAGLARAAQLSAPVPQPLHTHPGNRSRRRRQGRRCRCPRRRGPPPSGVPWRPQTPRASPAAEQGGEKGDHAPDSEQAACCLRRGPPC